MCELIKIFGDWGMVMWLKYCQFLRVVDFPIFLSSTPPASCLLANQVTIVLLILSQIQIPNSQVQPKATKTCSALKEVRVNFYFLDCKMRISVTTFEKFLCIWAPLVHPLMFICGNCFRFGQEMLFRAFKHQQSITCPDSVADSNFWSWLPLPCSKHWGELRSMSLQSSTYYWDIWACWAHILTY